MNFIEEIEKKYPIENVMYDGRQAWPVLRILYFFELRNKENQPDKKLNINSLEVKLKKLSQIFKGVYGWMSLRDYWCFSDSTENKMIGNKVQNKLFFEIFNQLGAENVTYFEKPVMFHDKESVNPNCVSTSMIDVMAFVRALFLRVGTWSGEMILQDIQRDYGIEINDEKLMRIFQAYSQVFASLLTRKNPKAVFVSDYYNLCHMAMIDQCRQYKIPIIELQHGVVNRVHPAYNFYSDKIERWVCPTYLLAFGERVKSEIDGTSYIDKEKIIPIGHPYVENIRNEKVKNFDKPGPIVGITLQWTDEDRVIDFIINAARLNRNIFYAFIPREPNLLKYSQLDLPPNVWIEKEKNFYQMMQVVDFHVTTYSTCALEAPCFGVPNILLDFDGMAKKYFGNVLSDEKVSVYLTEPEDFIQILQKPLFEDREAILAGGDLNITRGYSNKLSQFLKALRIS